METMLRDWKFYAFAFQSLITIFGFIVIKYNDFSHVAKDFQRLFVKVEEIDKKVQTLTTKVAVLEDRTEE